MAIYQQTYGDGYSYSSMPRQKIDTNPIGMTAQKSDWWAELNKLLFTLETSRSQFFTTLVVQVFANRVTLTYRPFIGAGETSLTYNASDIGNVLVNKSRKWASVGLCAKNSGQPLFEVKRLKHAEAERLKEALEKMMAFNYLMFRR